MKTILLALLLVFPIFAHAQLTSAQQTTLVTALKAETNPTLVAALANRNDAYVLSWCNAASAVNAWNPAVHFNTLVAAAPLTLYDGLTQGKRDEWRLLGDYNDPMDMTRQVNRDTIVDAWGTLSRSVPILQAGVRLATHAETYFGGTTATTNTVSALILTHPGTLDQTELSDALNNNP